MVKLEPNNPRTEACRVPTNVFDESNVSILIRGLLLGDIYCPLLGKKYGINHMIIRNCFSKMIL